jgi:hypothetical protein
MLVAAGVLAGAGVVLVVTSSRAPVTTALRLSPGQAALSGSF